VAVSARCCAAALQRAGKLYGGRSTDGETWSCPTCGTAWVHTCDEGEGCEWVEAAPAGVAHPKPARRVNVPKHMERGAPMRPKGDTAYANRERLTGKMWFIARALTCAARAVEGAGPCVGVNQCAHLGDRRTNGGFRKCPDAECGCLCAEHHGQVDNGSGWTASLSFYLRMTPDERDAFRRAAIAAADQAWLAMTVEQREWWDDQAARELARRREARRSAA
jgi:hypothetical protein